MPNPNQNTPSASPAPNNGAGGQISPKYIREEGAGKAYQSVAQSMAIAVQDAADNLRNMQTISSTSQGVAMAKFLETMDPAYLMAIEYANKMAANAAQNFQTIGTNAADVLTGFPSGQ
ncbi:MAG TPA: hypothetical protein DCE41_30015 [Cytophagales bacterium]|nr:hypothetical protein [Cytophagales bacterium]HAA24260.1 hypothetical protein [Cytophagales bacterium]HAP63809.1 hypothetical protein [Cytophagales bacterium]